MSFLNTLYNHVYKGILKYLTKHKTAVYKKEEKLIQRIHLCNTFPKKFFPGKTWAYIRDTVTVTATAIDKDDGKFYLLDVAPHVHV